MPDLSIKASHAYWKQYPDPMIYRVLSFMESVESWCETTDTSFDEKLKQLGTRLDDLKRVDLEKMGQQALFIQLGNHLKMTRTLYLLQTLDIAHPGSAAKLLMHAEASSKSSKDEAGFFLQRNIAFERLRLLSRVFSEERLSIVLKSLEED